LHQRSEATVKYLCLCYQEESDLDALSKCESDAYAGESPDYCAELRQSGHLVAAFHLQPAHTTTSIRVQNGDVSIIDGPSGATVEQLGGFMVIEARDLNEAIRLTSRIPPARQGYVEIRPLRESPAP
jgi:hypothetical protein